VARFVDGHRVKDQLGRDRGAPPKSANKESQEAAEASRATKEAAKKAEALTQLAAADRNVGAVWHSVWASVMNRAGARDDRPLHNVGAGRLDGRSERHGCIAGICDPGGPISP